MTCDSACIIYIHGNPWDGVPARQRYLMEEMSRFLPVYFLENEEDRRWRVSWKPLSPQVTVIRGLMPMWVRFRRRGWRWGMSASGAWHLRRLRQQYRKIVLWDAENWLRSYRFVPHDFFIYDCIDPCFSDDRAEQSDFRLRDADYCRRADLVLASADSLVSECRRYTDKVTLLNNACAPQEYEPALVSSTPRPAWWPAGDGAIAAYLGTLDARFDFAAMAAACTAHPDVRFVLAGTILAEHREQLDDLLKLGNVTAPGRISVADGRYLLAHCTLGLIPFKVGQMNDGVNPVKMYAYALMGKPIAGMNTRELRGRPRGVLVGSTPASYAAAVGEAIKAAESVEIAEALRDFAMENTWRHRAMTAWQVLSAALDLGGRDDAEPVELATAG